VCSQPSASIASRVAAGFSKYPLHHVVAPGHDLANNASANNASANNASAAPARAGTARAAGYAGRPHLARHRVEARHHDLGEQALHRPQRHAPATRRVEQRHRVDPHVTRFSLQDLRVEPCVVGDPPVAQDGALGEAGGSRRVLDLHLVVRPDLRQPLGRRSRPGEGRPVRQCDRLRRALRRLTQHPAHRRLKHARRGRDLGHAQHCVPAARAPGAAARLSRQGPHSARLSRQGPHSARLSRPGAAAHRIRCGRDRPGCASASRPPRSAPR
jgi:hypothetical protein